MRKLLLSVLTAGVLFACKKEEEKKPIYDGDNFPSPEISVEPEFGSEHLILDHAYALNDSTDIQIAEIKFYMSNIMGDGIQVKDYALFDYRNNGKHFIHMLAGAEGFNNFSAMVGVPSSVNHSDPSAFPSGSPLSTLVANDMYWGWAGGFIFLKIEAKADTIPDGIANFDHSLVYHVATDGFSGNVSFPTLTWEGPQQEYATLKLDVEKIFNRADNRIEVRTEHTTPHMPAQVGSLTEKVMNNFIAALSAQ